MTGRVRAAQRRQFEAVPDPHAAFQAALAAWHPDLVRLAEDLAAERTAQGHPPLSVAELVGEALLAARRAPAGDPLLGPRTWLLALVLRAEAAAADREARVRRIAEALPDAAARDALLVFAEPDPEPERRAPVIAAAALPHALREIYVLHAIWRLPLGRAARILGLGEDEASRRFARAIGTSEV
jgi:DNA-directed RNA polymerase specialized sigma24 family protein